MKDINPQLPEIKRLHRAAMEMVDEALIASQANDSATAQRVRRKAFELERSAAQSLAAEVLFEPTRSTLFRSAATLAFECGDPREAERLARAGLTGTTPVEIRVEIEALLDELGTTPGASTISEVDAAPRTPPAPALSGSLAKWDVRQGQRVVLLDLDSTLFDSKAARTEAWRRALEYIRPKVAEGPEVLLNAYQAIYDCHELITDRYGRKGHLFEDVRQHYNTRTSYALLIAWHKMGMPNDPLADFHGELTALLRPDPSLLLNSAEEIGDTWCLEYVGAIADARAAFWRGNWKDFLYPGVRELLRSMQERAIEYYIATEGHGPTQWHKIVALGLNELHGAVQPLVQEGQLLSTSQAARPQEAMWALEKVYDWYRGRAAASRKAAEMLKPGNPAGPELEINAAGAELVADGLRKISEVFDWLRKKFHIGHGRAVQPDFYLRILYAINQAPRRPASKLTEFDLKWDPERRIRLVMVGDHFRNDIEPVLQLANVLKKKIIPIWVKQGEHGKEAIDYPEDRAKQWIECETIQEAGSEYLLNDGWWISCTETLGQPTPLFVSAIQPEGGNILGLHKNVQGLLAGFSAIESRFELTDRQAPERDVIDRAARFVREFRRNLIADISASKEKGEVVERAMIVCREASNRPHLKMIAGLQNAAVDFVLSVAQGSGLLPHSQEHEHWLTKLAGLLKGDPGEQQAAVVRSLDSNPDVVTHIRESSTLRSAFLAGLEPIVESEVFPPRFPIREAANLHAVLLSSPETTELSYDSDESHAQGVLVLGLASTRRGRQQSVYLGEDHVGREVRCLLGGPEAGNIVCICGKKGSGKSTTLGLLIRGALRGEPTERPGTPRSSVIVFHHQLSGPSSLVEAARKFECTVRIFALENQIQAIRRDYGALAQDSIQALRVQLAELPCDLALRWMGLTDRASAEVFRPLYEKCQHSGLAELRNQVENLQGVNHDRKREILGGLDLLSPIVASGKGAAFSQHLLAGELTVIDFGRGGSRGTRPLAWETVLAVVPKHFGDRESGKHFLLVFDELYQISRPPLDQNAQEMVSRLNELSRMGRHQHVSILAASQDPADFSTAEDLWKTATVVLTHRLDGPANSVPEGELWRRMRDFPSFPQLATGEAWYCASQAEHPDRPITGRVKVVRL